MRRQGTRIALLRAFLVLFLAAAPTVTWGFTFLPLPSSSSFTTQHPLPTTTTALASQRQPPSGDAGGKFIDHSYDGEGEAQDPYLMSLKRGQAGAPAPAGRGPVMRTAEEIKAINDAAKARMEAYARGEKPPGFGASAQAPTGLAPSTPTSPEGFNPNKFMDFYREHEAKLAAENAAKAAEAAARGPPPPPRPSGAPIVQAAPEPYVPPARYQQQPTPEQAQAQQAAAAQQQKGNPQIYEQVGSSRFKGVFDAAATAPGTNPAKERLKQFLLSKYAPDDMSEQAVNYRRLIHYADTGGYSGPQTEDSDEGYISKLKADAREKIKNNPWQTIRKEDLARGESGVPLPPSTPTPQQQQAQQAQHAAFIAQQAKMTSAWDADAADYSNRSGGQGQGQGQSPPPPPPGWGSPAMTTSSAAGPYVPPPHVPSPPPLPPPQAYYQAPLAAVQRDPFYSTPPPPPPPVYAPPPPPPPQTYLPPPPSPAMLPKMGIESSLTQLGAYLTAHKAVGERLKGADLDKLEQLLTSVISMMQEEGGRVPAVAAAAAALLAVKARPVNGYLVEEKERQVLLSTAAALEVLATLEASEEGARAAGAQVPRLINLLQDAIEVVAGPEQREEEQPQQQRQKELQEAVRAAAPPSSSSSSSPPAPTLTPSSPPSSSFSAPALDIKKLTSEERAKMQGTMALVLKHSGAFGKMSGPLRGEELGLLKNVLGETMTLLRGETEEAYGTSVEQYLEENPGAMEELRQAQIAAEGALSQFPVPSVPPPPPERKSYKELLEVARRKKEQRA